MADRFLREVGDMHQLRKDIRLLPRAKAEAFVKRLGDDAAFGPASHVRDSAHDHTAAPGRSIAATETRLAQTVGPARASR
jgi:hypothetical protein